MKTFLVAVVATIGLALGAGTQKASAYWVTQTAQRFDPLTATYVTIQQRRWVPDPVVVYESPVYYPPVVRVVPPVRIVPTPIVVRLWYPRPIIVRP
jgi:hypothetical protein